MIFLKHHLGYSYHWPLRLGLWCSKIPDTAKYCCSITTWSWGTLSWFMTPFLVGPIGLKFHSFVGWVSNCWLKSYFVPVAAKSWIMSGENHHCSFWLHHNLCLINPHSCWLSHNLWWCNHTYSWFQIHIIICLLPAKINKNPSRNSTTLR